MLNDQRMNVKEEIDKYVDRQLSANETDELWSRIIQEEDYYDYLNVAANVKAMYVPEGAVPAHYLKKLVYAGAAALLILMTVFAVFKITNQSMVRSVQPIAAIELPFQRSADAAASLTTHDKTIREAVLLYYNDDFDGAVGMLENELATTDNIAWQARLNITMGIFYYNSNKFNQAEKAFQSVISIKGNIQPLQLEKAYWYLGNSLYQLNETDAANKAMREVLQIDGAYSRLAQKNLDK